MAEIWSELRLLIDDRGDSTNWSIPRYFEQLPSALGWTHRCQSDVVSPVDETGASFVFIYLIRQMEHVVKFCATDLPSLGRVPPRYCLGSWF